jgi:cardiolipin synthase
MERRTRLSPFGWILAGVLLAYTVLVTPGRFIQCLDAPITTYQYHPTEGLGAELPPQIEGNEVELLVNGDEILPAMLGLIDSAEHSIRWHVMLFKPDDSGMMLAEALVNAAERGVEVQLAFDINQSKNAMFFAPYPPEQKERFNEIMPIMLEDMRTAGVTVLDSSSLTGEPLAEWSDAAHSFHADMRGSTCIDWNHVDHRKVLIVDDEAAIVGGMNVGNEYLYLIPLDLSVDSADEVTSRQEAGESEAWEKWQDSAVLVKGPVVQELVADFNLRWEVLGGSPVESATEPLAARGDVLIRVLNQGPNLPEISSGMVELMDSAEQEIFVAYPFVSHHVLLEHLEAASERGVRVVFVYPGDHNEVAVSRRLLRLLSRELIDAKVELYESNDRMNHTKIMVVDGQYVSIGSHNFNYRSVRHDSELNLLIADADLANEVKARIFEPYMAQAEQLTTPYDMNWTVFDRLMLPFT